MTTKTPTAPPLPSTPPELLLVAPSKIKPHSENLRHDIGDVADLAESIAHQGVVEPLIVAPTGLSKTPYLLIAGHRRLAAAKQAGLKQVPVVVRHDLVELPDQLEAMLTENGHRKGLSDVEEAEGYQQLLTFPGYTATKVAKATGRSTSYVRDRLKLNDLPQGAREQVHQGQVSIADGVALAGFVDDETTYAKLLAALGTREWAWELQRAKIARERAKATTATLKALKAAGVRVIDRPDGFPWQTRHTVAPLADSGYGSKISVAVTAAGHETCPGHAAIVDEDGTAVYVCTETALRHHQTEIDDTPAAGADPESRAAAEEVEAQRVAAARQRTEDLETAAALREAFLLPYLRGAKRLTPSEGDKVVRTFLVVIVGRDLQLTDDWFVWAKHTGMPELDLGDNPAAASAAITGVEHPNLLMLAWVASLVEPALRPRTLGWVDEWIAHEWIAWFDLLTLLGYVRSDFEETHLYGAALAIINANDPDDANTADPDDDDAAEDVASDDAGQRPVEDAVAQL